MKILSRSIIAVIAIGHCLFAAAQDSIPVLKGKVTISIQNGTIECDLTLSNIPPIEDYLFRLNSGMNIRNFTNVAGRNYLYWDRATNDTLSTGESVGYYFPAGGGKKFLPGEIQFRYVGMFPVMRDTINNYSVQDWKGNLAFNGYSLRADGRQSAWYPLLFDRKKDRGYEQVKYDLEIRCDDCNMMYLNGSKPAPGPVARFSSDIPRELTIYLGNYKVQEMNGTFFLNPDINTDQLKQFGMMINSYKNFYEEKIGIKYKDNITFIQTTPVSKDNAWLFVSYPSIVNIGYGDYGMKSFFNKKTGDWFKPYMAHELGHYYFGTYKRFNAELGDMLSEGFAEFLALKVARKLVSDSVYSGKVKNKLKNLKGFDAIPFGKVANRSDYTDRELYVYNYAPIIFTAIEKEIGEDRMWAWIKSLLTTPTAFTNYAFVKETLASVLKDQMLTERLASTYFTSNNSLANAVKAIN
ncbi:MAG TPA: hypothetical protein VLC28_13380 [Flavitalea sp.]|nr:hypothetical protein [Flavitalea sp.]